MGPRLVGALALVVLAGAGAADLLIPARPASLVGQSNWALAQTLPTQDEFPAAWNYRISGAVGFATPRPAPDTGGAESQLPTADYTPGECGALPAALLPAWQAPELHIDRTPVGVARARAFWAGMVAAGDRHDAEPNAEFTITAPADPAGLVDEYLDWLGRCGSYRVSVFDPSTDRRTARSAVTSVEHPAAGAALTVTQGFLDDADDARPHEYRLSLYPVRGLLLTCRTSFVGADADRIDALAAETARKLAAL